MRQEKGEAGNAMSRPATTEILAEKYGEGSEVTTHIHCKKMAAGTKKDFAVKKFIRQAGETEKLYRKRLTAKFCISSSLLRPIILKNTTNVFLPQEAQTSLF